MTPRTSRGLLGLILSAGLLLWAAAPARADVLYQTGFEQPTFVPGSVIGQDNWGSGTAVPGVGLITTMNPSSGLQALQMPGSGLVDVGGGLVGASFRRRLDYDTHAHNTPFIYVQADARLNGPSTDHGHGIDDDLISANISVADGNGRQIAALILSSNGNIYAFANDGDTVYQFGTAAALDTYHTLGMALDFNSRMTEFFFDGKRLGTLVFGANITSDVFRGLYVEEYAVNDPGFSTTPYTAYFDNYLVQAIPEPSTLVLASLGVLGLLGYGRRRWRTA